MCIAVIAVVAGAVASGLSGGLVRHATMVVVPLASATLLLYRRRPGTIMAELVRLGLRSGSTAPRSAGSKPTPGSSRCSRCPVTDLVNAVDTPSATVRELADLARAGYRVLHEPSMLVDFEIHHVVDRAGVAWPGSSRATRPAALSPRRSSAGANGVGVVVGTRIAEAPGRAYRQADASVRLEHRDDEHATFRGSERPNSSPSSTSPHS